MGSGHISNPSSYRGGSDNEKSSQRENNNYQRNPLSLAIKHHTTIGCPLTTGIFAWISAHAAEEQQQQGAREITPYWRTLKTGGLLNEKYPGGLESQRKLLEQEGHVVIQKGKKSLLRIILSPLFC